MVESLRALAWILFASGAIVRENIKDLGGSAVEGAANVADGLLEQFESRFEERYPNTGTSYWKRKTKVAPKK